MKSALWLASESANEAMMEARLQPSLNPLKEQVWKVPFEPKIKTFLWKVLSSALPVDEGFRGRGMKSEEFCQMCGNHKETINHACLVLL